MAIRSIYSGSTSVLLNVFLKSSSTGNGLSGLAYNTASLTAYFVANDGTASTAITLVSGTLGTWISGGFAQVDATNMPGVYQLGLPNAVFAIGQQVTLVIQGASGMAQYEVDLEVTATNNQDAQRGGLLALPNGPMQVPQNTALLAQVIMFSNTDHVTPVAGLTVVSAVSVNGVALAPTVNQPTGLSNGLYNLQLEPADMNGPVVTVMFSATGADTQFLTFYTQPD